jgi:hypothetical protein
MKKIISILITLCFTLVFCSYVHAIGIRINASGGVLENVRLVTSVDGEPPRGSVCLGDIDLTQSEHVFDIPIDAAQTHWWLIGSQGNDVIYSSSLDLYGIDFYSIEPYDGPSAYLIFYFGTPDFCNLGFDVWAQTVNNHQSHVTFNGLSSSLWGFDPKVTSLGYSIGDVAMNLHSNDIPPDYNDLDGDGINDDSDNCPAVANPGQ